MFFERVITPRGLESLTRNYCHRPPSGMAGIGVNRPGCDWNCPPSRAFEVMNGRLRLSTPF
ncbi:hypothetical protein QJS10_CPA09g00311 [Acorus calamus]|uniref:Uncharacterized protein n=1 Tax=Acorus calamus TaxID=4465 RepID=A0AAV9E726_ACOCL|nr:hypothetical protein QJS10_CPA09g00311 [Acorus calamus]